MEKGGLERYTIIVRKAKHNIGGKYIAIMVNDACEELAMGIGGSPYRALLMVAHKVGELEGIPEGARSEKKEMKNIAVAC